MKIYLLYINITYFVYVPINKLLICYDLFVIKIIAYLLSKKTTMNTC